MVKLVAFTHVWIALGAFGATATVLGHGLRARVERFHVERIDGNWGRYRVRVHTAALH